MKPVYKHDIGHFSVGIDPWGWSFPVSIDADYGMVVFRVLCFCLIFSWD